MRVKNHYEFKYEVNRDQKCVVCIATPTRYDDRLMTLMSITDAIMRFNGGRNKKIPNLYYDTFFFKGIAKYKEGDEFDVESAKRIAKAKALRQANGVMADLVFSAEEQISTFYRTVYDMRVGTSIKKDEYIQRIKNYTKPQ